MSEEMTPSSMQTIKKSLRQVLNPDAECDVFNVHVFNVADFSKVYCFKVFISPIISHQTKPIRICNIITPNGEEIISEVLSLSDGIDIDKLAEMIANKCLDNSLISYGFYAFKSKIFAALPKDSLTDNGLIPYIELAERLVGEKREEMQYDFEKENLVRLAVELVCLKDRENYNFEGLTSRVEDFIEMRDLIKTCR